MLVVGEALIGRRHPRADRFAPRCERALESGNALGRRVSPVDRLGWITLEVVELDRAILVPLDQLPPPLPNGPGRGAASFSEARALSKGFGARYSSNPGKEFCQGLISFYEAC